MVKKLASILLALFFLMSSSHLSFATHFCGGHVFSHALVIDAGDLGCDSDNESDKEQIDKCESNHKCCDVKLIKFEIKDSFQAIESNVSFNQHFTFVEFASILFSFDKMTEVLISYKDYKPPLPDKDIPVLIQSFLI